MSPAEREEYGITEKLPKDLPTSLKYLRSSEQLGRVLGDSLVSDYIAMKEAEMKMLEAMPEDDQHIWLIERY